MLQNVYFTKYFGNFFFQEALYACIEKKGTNMSEISFKGIYGIPFSPKQNPLSANFQEMLKQTYGLRNEADKPVFNNQKDEYYLSIQDRYDKDFEKIADDMGIRIRKVSPKEVKGIEILANKANRAEKTKLFVSQAIATGAKHVIKNENGIKTIYLLNEDGKTPFGIYTFDTNNGGRLIKEETFLDGVKDSIHYYNENGNDNRVTFLHNNQKTSVNAEILKTI